MGQGRGKRAIPAALGLLVAVLIAPAPGGAVAQAPAAAGAAAQQVGSLEITGPSGQTVTLGRTDLAQLPAVTVARQREHQEGAPTAYAGPLLWAVLDRAGVLGQDTQGMPRARVRRVVTVTGRDGYTVALALAEIDPEFEGKSVILATQADGKPIGTGELRLVVPGDKRGGRSVRDPTKVVVR